MLTKFVSASLCYFCDNLKCDNFPLLILFFIFVFRFNSIFTSCYACRVTKIRVARFDECIRISAKNSSSSYDLQRDVSHLNYHQLMTWIREQLRGPSAENAALSKNAKLLFAMCSTKQKHDANHWPCNSHLQLQWSWVNPSRKLSFFNTPKRKHFS